MTEITQTHTENIPGCIRKMSPCERFFFMAPSCTVMMAARITGTIDELRFRQALDAISRVHPLLRAKIVFDEDGGAWFSSEDVPQVPLRIAPRTSEHQWLDELKSEARQPFDISRGPLIRCVLLQSPEVSDFLVLCNHSICDGMALAGLIRGILSRYAEPGQEIRLVTPPVAQEVFKAGFSFKLLFSRIFASYANRKWRKNPHCFGPEEYTALYRGYWEGRKPGVILFEFDKDESGRLQALCREYGITVGSAVSAACLGAHAELNGGFPKSQQAIMVPFDIRRRADPPLGDVFCLCVGSVRLAFAYNTKRSFRENAVSLHGAIHTLLKNPDPAGLNIPAFDPYLTDAMSAFGMFTDKVPEVYSRTEALQRFSRDTGNFVLTLNRNFENSIPGFIPSNLGRIDVPESFDGVRLERLVFLPAASELNPLVLGGIGVNGTMTFSLLFVDPPAKTGVSPEPEMIMIRNRALEYLGFPEKVHPGAME
ncbi:MAG: condensation domain-containing protein [Methanoregula sp.]|nr:condensation domain-containing protein [Methanoregula sp.]